MAISAATVWEARPTNGVDTNGGGFVAGATGIDYSQQNAKNTVGNNISTTDVVTAASTTITSATASFTSDIVGNIIYLQGGTGTLTAQWRQVVTFTNSTTVVLDQAVAISTGVTMNIGGALKTFSVAVARIAVSNKLFVKNEATFIQTSSILTAVGATPTATVPRSLIQGYNTTRGDSGRATIQLATNSGLTGITIAGIGWDLVNLIFDCNNLTSSIGITVSGGGSMTTLINCKVMNFTSAGFTNQSSGTTYIGCEATGGTSAATGGMTATGTFQVYDSYVHDNACPGIAISGTNAFSVLMRNVIANNTGATSDGFVSTATFVDNLMYNTFYGNGRHGINFNSNNTNQRALLNNILANNGGYGIMLNTTTGTRAMPYYDGNAFYSNTSGSRSNMNDTTVNPQDGVAPFTPFMDITCTSSPFINAAAADFRLNQTATGGGLIRGLGYPQSWPGLTGNRAFPDMGAIQHQDQGQGST